MRRYRIRPSKTAQKTARLFCIPFTLIAGSFVVIGVTKVIPSGVGLFGFVWTGMAVVFCAIGIYGLATGKLWLRGYGLDIEEGDGETESSDSAERLEELRKLYDRRLISQEEYEQKRKDILERL